jgi:adenylate kinase family enzyme
MKQQAFIFIGRSGSGKGTQAALLIEALKKADPSRGVRHIETGAEMRRFIQGPAATQQRAKGITDSGGLQPEFIAIYQWANVLVNQYNGTDHLIFDGSPRKMTEAGALDSIFPFYGIEKPWIAHLDVDAAEIHNRLRKRGRNDDTREAISRRLAWYETDVAPTVEFYRTNPDYRFLDIKGEGSIEAIHADFMKKIGLTTGEN